jgi:fructan beta-fructosidase
MKTALLCIAGLLTISAAASAADDLVIADFEGPDYGQWTVVGEAFGPKPAQGELPGQRPVTGFLGRGLVNTYRNGDGATGTLTSPPFKIERKYINFLIGGGNRPNEACVNVLVAGKIVRTSTGNNDERLDWELWDVANLIGKQAQIQIVDNATGGWGHVNVDQIVMSDRYKCEPAKPEKLYGERYRPQFHFSPAKNWTNDPNGMVFYKGEYHLFFQHNPSGINWGNMTWGHAVSPDMLHWRQLDHAIYPDKLGTIFSGSAVVDWNNTAGFQTGDEKVIVCMYTSAGNTSSESKGQPFTQSIAYSNDRGRTWTKYAKNPVLEHIAANNRDPKVLWHASSQKWVMALYLDKNDYALFSSPNLKQWTKLCVVSLSGASECPDFFELPVDGDAKNTKWAFWGANNNYCLGRFDGTTFTRDTEMLPTHWGANRYAAQTFSDLPAADGRRIQIAWMAGGAYPRMPFNQQMSFPVTLTLHTFPEGVRLCSLPVRELDSLHGRQHAWDDFALRPGENPLANVTGELFDIRLDVKPGAATEVCLDIRGTPIQYQVKDKRLSCLGKSAPVELADGRLAMQILVDRSSLEIFADDGRVNMAYCFLPPGDNKRLAVTARGGEATVQSLKVWELKSVWPKQ